MIVHRIRIVLTLATLGLPFVLPAFATGVLAAPPVVLYDGALGTKPQDQGWLVFGGLAASEMADGGVTRLVTVQQYPAGYSNYQAFQPTLVNSAFPVLDRAAGFELTFDVRINSESHSSNDRAGWSVTVIASDQRGIELGFWSDRIWAQEGGTTSLFTQAEGVARDTTAMTAYRLRVVGDSYTLYAAGSNDPLLSGAVRDYTAFDHAGRGLPYDVYETPNFLAWSDNTSAAQVDVAIARLAVQPDLDSASPPAYPVFLPLCAVDSAGAIEFVGE